MSLRRSSRAKLGQLLVFVSASVIAAVDVHLLIDYSMELGGKNALLLLDDAHVGQAVSGAERAAFSNAGQLCISIERMYIPATLWDVFVDRFVEAATALKLTVALNYSAEMGFADQREAAAENHASC